MPPRRERHDRRKPSGETSTYLARPARNEFAKLCTRDTVTAMDGRDHRRGLLLCGSAAALFGISTPIAAQLVDRADPITVAGLLYLGAGILMATRTMQTGATFATARNGGTYLALSVLFGGTLGPVLLMVGLTRVSAASASLLVNLELVATVLIGAALFREHIGRRLLTGVALVFAASLLLTWSPGVGLDSGAALIVLACVSWGIDNNVTARVDQIPVTLLVAVKGVCAGSINLTLGLLRSGDAGLTSGLAVTALALGAVSYGASITLWIRGARTLGAARAQLVFSLGPFIGTMFAWTVYGEPVRGLQLCSLVLAAAGVIFAGTSSHTHQHHHPELEHEHEHEHDDHHQHDDAQGDGDTKRHTHRHRHLPLEHQHPHTPDIHHQHRHGETGTDSTQR